VVTVEVEVFDGVVVETEFGQEKGSNIGVTLRHTFWPSGSLRGLPASIRNR
jgi:hypothetical protein